MKKQNVQGGQVIHVDISRWCTHKQGQRRSLIFECHVHKFVWYLRMKLAFELLMGRPVHLVMTGDRMRIGDREVSEIEL